MGDALNEIKTHLDERYVVAEGLLKHVKRALSVYDGHDVNVPRCSKEHLGSIVRELTDYRDELHNVRCNLPRLLENGDGRGD